MHIGNRHFSRTSLFILMTGALFIFALWGLASFEINQDYDRTVAEAGSETMNMAISFEEHVRRILIEIDKDLINMKRSYERGGLSDPVFLADAENAAEDSTRSLVAVFDEQGTAVASYIENIKGESRSDRTYFSIPRDNATNKMYVDPPVVGRLDGVAAIPFTRRISKPDGSFGGIVFIGTRADYFLSYYKTVNLGEGQLISLTHLDGYRLTRQTADISDKTYGTGELTNRVKGGVPIGSYTGTSKTDGISRIVSYRAMPEFPLIVAVGISTKVALSSFEQRKRGYIIGAVLANLLILILVFLLIKRQEEQRALNVSLAKMVNERTSEVEAQREELEAQNEELRAKESELVKHRDHLETLVQDRTSQLRASEEQYHKIFSLIPNGCSLLKVVSDQQGSPTDLEYVSVNSLYEQYLERSASQINGRRVTELFPNPGEETLTRVKKYISVAVTGTPISFTDYYRNLSKWYFTVAYSPEPGYVVVIAADVTEQRIAEQKIRENEKLLQNMNAKLEERVLEKTRELCESNVALKGEIEAKQVTQEELRRSNIALKAKEAHYRSLFENMQNLFVLRKVIVDEHGRPVDLEYLEVNPAYEIISGRKADEVVGRRLTEVYPTIEEEPFDWIQELGNVALTGQPKAFELFFGPGNKWFEFSAYSPQPGLVALVTADITARKEAEAEQRRFADEIAAANTELKAFVNTIAHDFRSPMVNLKGFSTELGYSLAELRRIAHEFAPLLPEEVQAKVDELIDKEVPDAQQFIDASVDRLNRMVNALLSLSRMGRRELNYSEVDMRRLVSAVLQSCQHQISEGNIHVEEGLLPHIQTDQLAMEQIIGNLVDNAIKYLDDNRKGHIEIGCVESKREYVITVKDNGRGIADDDREKIFEPFRRVGKQDQPGEGLGLAYVRALVRRLGGGIRCESEVGVGTAMIVVIPKHLQ